MRTVYLDNAATTYPKPPEVVKAVGDALTKYGGNPGRGSHVLSNRSGEVLFDCRSAIADLFSTSAENVSFTMNATQSLNFAIKGLINRGDHVLIDNFAHNASLRPLLALVNDGTCTYDIFDLRSLDSIERLIRSNTHVVIVTHHSNITSNSCSLDEISEICAIHRVKLIVDASQSAGHLPISMTDSAGITSLCMPGHKGLYGTMGVGVLVSSRDAEYRTIIEGGAGINSIDMKMPENLPERLEAGTLPMPAVCGLLKGVEFIKKTGIQRIHEKECRLSERLVRQMQKINGVRFFGETNGPVVSFNIDGISPAEIGKRLSENGVCVRTGYHCAPLAHKSVGSYENGSVRVSFSCFNRDSDVNELIEKLKFSLKNLN